MVTVKPPATPSSTGQGWALGIIGTVVLVILVGQCADDSSQSNLTALMNQSNAEMGNAIAAQAPAPAEPLSETSMVRGISHLRLAVRAEGYSGAMVYSQNCYDALARKFSWAKLDQCGAADMLAVRSIDSADISGLSSEAGYFESEAAAGRYLAAATGAGEPPGEADTRLSQLQSRLARERLAGVPAPVPKQDDAVIDGDPTRPEAKDTLDQNWIDNAIDAPDGEGDTL